MSEGINGSGGGSRKARVSSNETRASIGKSNAIPRISHVPQLIIPDSINKKENLWDTFHFPTVA